MRKLSFFLILALFVTTLGVGSAWAVGDPNSIGIKKRTTGARQGEAVRVFKLVRHSASTPNDAGIVSEDVVVYDTISDDGITVRLTTTSNDGAIAGIAVMTIETSDATTGTSAFDDEGRRNWGYILVHGPMTASIGAGAINAAGVGAPFITSSDAGQVTGFQGAPPTGDLDNEASGGFFMDAATSGTAVDVFVELE